MILACDHVAQLTFLTKDDENDELRCRWRIFFHNYSLISIQNEKYKGWMILKQHIKTGIYVLSMENPRFDTHGQPIMSIENARQFKNIYAQFQLCPVANCKDIQCCRRNHRIYESILRYRSIISTGTTCDFSKICVKSFVI